jgi:hypothetical protein
MKTEPQKEHEWLHQLLGEWTSVSEVRMGPDDPVEKVETTELVRSLEGVWVVCEARGEMPGGGPSTTIMTLGFDPARGRYVGTWIGSMMTYLWVYDGWLDPTGKVLTLEAEGPDMEVEGKLAKYRDVIEIKSDDYRTMTAQILGDDGEWHGFMTTHYRRKP